MNDNLEEKNGNISQGGVPGSKKINQDWEKIAQEYLDGWKRERAAFENYKKDERVRNEEVEVWIKRAMLLKLLPILDSFELALRNTPDHTKQSEWFKGYTYIQKQLEEFLRSEGVEIIEEAREFDPRLHEAVDKVNAHDYDNKDDKNEQLIVEEVLQKGYRIGDIVIRPARVRVARKEVGKSETSSLESNS